MGNFKLLAAAFYSAGDNPTAQADVPNTAGGGALQIPIPAVQVRPLVPRPRGANRLAGDAGVAQVRGN